jgi:peroxiredoxin
MPDAPPAPAPVAAIVAPEAPPAQPWNSMSYSIADAEMPPPLPAPVSDPALPPAAADLSPVVTLPGWWTTDQEEGAAKLLQRYRGQSWTDSGGYNDPPPDISRARPVWHGKPMPQTRFLGSDGSVLDLANWKGKKVVLVVMRGFSGQVCIYCATQTAALAEAAAGLRDKGVETLVVYPGPPAAVPAFLKAVASLRGSPPPLPVALDAGLTLVRGLKIAGNLSLPATFILDGEGIVRWTYVGTSIADRPSVVDIRTALDGIR